MDSALDRIRAEHRQKVYEQQEAHRLRQQIDEVEAATLAERREARIEYADVLAKDPAIVSERVGWLLAGNYGYGSYVAARKIADSPRMNRPAALGSMIAALEWSCPAAFAHQAFNGLTQDQQEYVTIAIDAEIAEYEDEKAEQATT